jgi:hypothetical protein
VSEHSIIPPSSSARRLQCPGSAMLEQMFPSPDTDASIEGTKAHELAASMVIDAAQGATGRTETTGYTQEMLAGAKMYADDIQAIMRTTGVFAPHVEERTHSPNIHEECWGTPDCWLWDPAALTLYLYDYKFGHLAVEVEWNTQLIEYAEGIIANLTELEPLTDNDITAVFTIVQPRARHRDGPIRRWTVKASALRGIVNRLSAAEHKALGPDPQCHVGPECRNCSARHVCEIFTRCTDQIITWSGTPSTINLDPAALAAEMRLVNEAHALLTARKKGLDAQAEGHIQAGTDVPGWGLEQGYGRTVWARPTEEVLALGQLYGKDLAKPADPITPKQAIKLGIDAAVIKDYSKTPRTAAKLVPIHNAAKEAFEQ